MKRPLLMGILNVTPDSFSDGGRYVDPSAAVAHAHRLIRDGADIIDVGGESTRPGAAPVPAAEELRRVVPVLERLRSCGVTLSIDTRKPEVAAAAVEAGATILNDVGGGADPAMREIAAGSGATIVLMHMRGEPRTMQDDPRYPRGVVTEVADTLRDRVGRCVASGIALERIWIDPGIGFGKTLEQNLELLRELPSLKDIGGGIVVGVSRKSFLARILGDPGTPIADREAGSLAAGMYAWMRGASVLRVHDVAAHSRALSTWNAIEAGAVRRSVVLALGTNQGDRQANLEEAVRRLRGAGIFVDRIASVYESPPWKGMDQPHYLNTVVVGRTDFSPERLLSVVKGIEAAMGRKPAPRYSPRPIDIDVISLGETVVSGARINIPHPEMTDREFVLDPLTETWPEWRHPGLNRTARELLEDLKRKRPLTTKAVGALRTDTSIPR